MGEENTEYLEALEARKNELENKNAELSSAISNSSFNSQNENLVQYQLSTDDVLEKLDHYLKGDIIQTDPEGNTFYSTPKNKDLIILNDYGSNSIMQILGNYVNRITSSSFYDEERIFGILADLGDELNKFMYCNYEKMGLDTGYKRTRYGLLILSVLHIVESSYRKAIGGNEMKLINSTNLNIAPQFNNVLQRPLSSPKKKGLLGLW